MIGLNIVLKMFKTAHQDQLKYVKQEIGKIQKVSAEYKKASQDLEVSEQQILFSIANGEKKIDSSGREAKARVDRQCSDLKAELRRKHEPKLQEYQRQKEVLQKRVNELQRILADVKKSEDMTGQDFLQQYKPLIERLKKVQNQETMPIAEVHPKKVTFQVKELGFQIGSLNIEETNEVRKSSKDMQRKFDLFTELCEFRRSNWKCSFQ